MRLDITQTHTERQFLFIREADMGVLTIRKDTSSGTVLHTEQRLTAPSYSPNPSGAIVSGAMWNCKNKVPNQNIVIGGKTFAAKDQMMDRSFWAKYDASQPLVIFEDGTWGAGYSVGSFEKTGFWDGTDQWFMPSMSVSGNKLYCDFPGIMFDHSTETRDDEDYMNGWMKLALPLPLANVQSVTIKFSNDVPSYPSAFLINADLATHGCVEVNFHASSPEYNPYRNWEYLYYNSKMSPDVSLSLSMGVSGSPRVRARANDIEVSPGSPVTFTLTPTVVSGDTNLWLYISNYASSRSRRHVYIDHIKINTK